MGYTHYYYRRELEHPKAAFADFVGDVKRAVALLPKFSLSSGGVYARNRLVLAGGNGKGKPEFTDESICFNGKDGKADLAHETFSIERVISFDQDGHFSGNNDYGIYLKNKFESSGEHFEFCKTARKPYDLAVQIVLILYKCHFGDKVRVTSDGDTEDWQVASQFVLEHFGIVSIFSDSGLVISEEDDAVI